MLGPRGRRPLPGTEQGPRVALGPLRRGLWPRHVSGERLGVLQDSVAVCRQTAGSKLSGADPSRTNPGSLKEKLKTCAEIRGPGPRRASPRAARGGNNTEFSQKARFSSLLKLGPPAHGPEQGSSSWGQEGHPSEAAPGGTARSQAPATWGQPKVPSSPF